VYGIDAEKRESSFERGHTTLQRGTGYGLSIVKQIVDAHGWDIRARASDADGARFEIAGVTFVD
jgi:signal transduction histidine kinase